MKSTITKVSPIFVLAVLLLLILFVKEASSGEHDCNYEKQKFTTGQMLKQKVKKNINFERSPFLIGVDALFL